MSVGDRAGDHADAVTAEVEGRGSAVEGRGDEKREKGPPKKGLPH